tara:strand:- start:348 stop:716 length:369 start_codon:yes stop_codon:yes gene_type:complete
MTASISSLLEVLMVMEDGYILETDKGFVLQFANAYTVSVSKDGEGYNGNWTSPVIAEDPDSMAANLSESLSSTCNGENVDKVQSASDLIKLILEVKSKGKVERPDWHSCGDENCCGRDWQYE